MRTHALWILLAAAVPGLLFAPVFGVMALVPPIAAVVVACYAVFELCVRVPALRPWRPLLVLVAGLLALVEVALFPTTRGGLPTMDSVAALVAGARDSWQLTLQSTWPVQPEAELLLFVPMLVLFTAMVGLELVRWPALAALPSLMLLVVSQAFFAVSGTVATLVALVYAAVVAGLFVTRGRSAVVLTVVLSVVAGLAAATVGHGPAYSVHDRQSAQAPLPRKVSPLSEIAARLADPEARVFSYTSDAPVDRWRLVVLERFDGVTWAVRDDYRWLGSEIGPQPGVTVPATAYSAKLTVLGDDPWVPSQAMPASVNGIDPLINQDTGTLFLPERTGPVSFELRWWEQTGDLSGLADAGVASGVAPGDLGVVPPRIAELARTATGGARPTFRAAVMLDRYLSENYAVVTGANLPTGSGWPQLRRFLLDAKQGTSEQFAAAYVVLARLVGIPARLVVGFRAPRLSVDGEMVVRNKDVLAWPEVAVEGVGWVPLDPAGAASGAAAPPSPLGRVVAKTRADLPPRNTKLPEPPLPAAEPADDPGAGFDLRAVVPWVAAAVAGLLVLVVVAVPVARFARTVRRRRRSGVPGVVAAWSEARDLLRAHGDRVTPGMTPRDLAATADGSVADSLRRLAVHLDTALWSGSGASEATVAAAWDAVREIRGVLARRSPAARVRAVYTVR